MPYDVAFSLVADAGVMQGSAARDSTPRPAAGGKAPPAGGKAAPAVERDPPRPADVTRAIQVIETYLRESARGLRLNYDEASGRTIITVVDLATGETVRQIPAEEILALARRAADAATVPALFDALA